MTDRSRNRRGSRAALTTLALAGALIGAAATSAPAAASDRLAETVIGAVLYYGLTHAQPAYYYDGGYYYDEHRRPHRARNHQRRHRARDHRRADRHAARHNDRRHYSRDRGRGGSHDDGRRSRRDRGRDHDSRDRRGRRGH